MMATKSKYDSCLQEMYSLRRFGIKLGLGTTEKILKSLGNPQNKFSTIHVAGTNGKGSVASALSKILGNAGYKTGLYTSPHLVRFNERIRINGREIRDSDIVKANEAVKQAHHGGREPTFFEYTTAMALHEFGRQNVDWAVIETGMGGRLDSTNVLKPSISIITNLSLEHQEYLGGTLSMIAMEKGGIIKQGVPVVTGVRQKNCLEILNKTARDNSAPFFRIGKDFKVIRHKGKDFSYYGMSRTWRNLETSLLGNHQVENAALTLAACELLIKGSDIQAPLSISEDNIRQGLKTNKWPGRLEIISNSPMVILDGAHNMASVKSLSRFLEEELKQKKITLVTGILDDKAYGPMLKTLLPLCEKVVLTSPRIDRGLAPEKLFQAAEKIAANVEIVNDVVRAVNHAIKDTGPMDAVCIAGSLYVVGEVKEAIEKGEIQLNQNSSQG